MREFEIGPDYVRAPELSGRPLAGRMLVFTMNSADSAIYPGIRRIDNAVTRRRDAYGNRLAAKAQEQSEPASYVRTVWVYVQEQLPSGAAAPLLLVQDGHAFLNTVPCVLDALVAGGRAPAQVAILIDSGGGDAQGSQRGLEYDTLSDRYSDFV